LRRAIADVFDDRRSGRRRHAELGHHVEQGCGIRGRPYEIGGHLDRKSKPTLGGDGSNALDQQREGLLRSRYLSALKNAAFHCRVEPGARRRETQIIVPAIGECSHRVEGLDRRLFAFEQLRERLCHGGAKEAVCVAVVMVERGSGDVRDRADTARRELRLAFFLKNLQSHSEQSSACVHAGDIAVI
jgi:hypothetical protein